MKRIGIIGAGIVGLATAIRLKERNEHLEVSVFEKNPEQFLETSTHNSGVVHSGIHQHPDLLRSKLARSGGPRLIEFCLREGVPVRKAGMLIVVSSRDLLGLIGETRSLIGLIRNSREQKIKVKVLAPWQIRKIEPEVKALFGLLIEDIWVVNQKALGDKMVSRAKSLGVELHFDSGVIAIRNLRDTYELDTWKGTFAADVVVNSAGLYADYISSLAGFPGYTIHPWRGEYYEVRGPKRDLLKGALIYPALRPGSPVKGVHLTKTFDGRLLIGPNAKPWHSRSDDINIRTPKEEFLREAQKFLPSLTAEDLTWSYAGIRPKINSGKGEDDFVIKLESKNPAFLNFIGIESPGFAAGFGIADYGIDLLEKMNLIA